MPAATGLETRAVMTPEAFRAWQRIFRDFVIVIVGAFMLVYATVFQASPSPYVIGGGLAALGLVPALRLDELLSGGRKE